MQFRIGEYFLKFNNSEEMLEHIVAFFKIIQKYPYLYDQTLSGYLWEYLKENSWKEVAKEMKCSVNTCKEIWINILYIMLLSKLLKLSFPDTLEFVFFMEKETRETLPSILEDHLMSPTKNKWFSCRRLWEIISHWFASLFS
ncbi:uncharacterized protein LOC117607946 [Osmia lignaria lignaria]|uniref:uncharacterized protein LOC117607946 n=1 Tax=Osmia lignaria lignaria TaxID=1437193 RepID=UPI0014791EFE|nr:uncharacterized protein LOC117607946 [Osmia lignaria]XP_034188139.1 uncharacterized protein LOC117607946 [Osmia lignaria]